MANKRPPNSVELTPSGIEIAFYDEIGVDGKPQQRRYTVNGSRVANVTSVLNVLAKEALLGWVERLTKEGKNWRDERNKAGERGTDAHHLLLQALTGGDATLADLPDDYRPYGQAAFRWLRKRRPVVVETERMVASTEHNYAGRLDLLAGIDGARTLTDFKTVTKWSYKWDRKAEERTTEKYPPYDENLLQLDLYQRALIESGYDPAERGLIVRLGPDGDFDETYVNLDPERGLAILGAYRAKSRATSALKDARKAQEVREETQTQIDQMVAAS